MSKKDPIDQEWIKTYIDQLLKVAERLPVGSAMRQSAMTRAEHVMDLVSAWQGRQT